MANNSPLGYNITINSLDKQFGEASQPQADRTEDIVAVTGEEISTTDAKTKVTDSSSNQYYEAFLRGYTQNKTAEELKLEAEDMGTKANEFIGNSSFISEQALTVNNTDYSRSQSTYLQTSSSSIEEPTKNGKKAPD